MNCSKYIVSYVLDWTKLQPCDIVLSRKSLSLKGLFHQKRLCEATKSGVIRLGSKHYSHAMLYVGSSVIHAHPPMVFAVNPQRLSAAHDDDYVCLRFNGLTLDQKQKIEEYARGRIGALYSVTEAAKTMTKKLGDERDLSGLEFCSRLVAEAYDYAGIGLVKNISYCAPGDFLSVASLINMGSCTRRLDEHDKAIINSEDYVLLSQERSYKWLQSVNSLAAKDGLPIETLNSVFEYVLRFPKRDGDVFGLLKESGYLETWKDDAKAHGYRYDPMAMADLHANQKSDFCNEVVCLFDCVGRYGDELISFDQINGSLQTINANANMYRDMLNDIQRRAVILVLLFISQPGVGPLSTLHAMCDHIINGSYSQHYSLPVRDETAKLRDEWKQQTGMH